MSDVEQAFTELFYGSGSWLGLLLLLAIIMVLATSKKYLGLVMIPVTVFLGISYLSYSELMWHSIIMFLSSIFIVISIVKRND